MEKFIGTSTGETLAVRLSFVCPFCGRAAAVCDPYAVMHAEPACVKFRDLEPTDYLHAVNVANGAYGN